MTAGFSEIVTEKVSLDALLGEAAKGRGELACLLSSVAAGDSEGRELPEEMPE